MELNIERRGDGPPLVCHPGGPGFGAAYFTGFDVPGRELVIVEPRGCGRSPAATAFAFDDYVADLEEVREQLGLDRFDLLGHSHGGMVAQAFAIAHPDRLDHLVLANTAARLGPEQLAGMEQAMARRSDEPWFADAVAALEEEQAGDLDAATLTGLVRRELPFYFVTWDERAQAYADAATADPICADALGVFNREVMTAFDHRPGLPTVTAPTLVLTGDADFITPPEAGREMAGLLPHARMVVLEGAGHFAWIESPAFAAEVERFLREG